MKKLIVAACLLTALPLVAETGREFHYKTEMTGAGIPGAFAAGGRFPGYDLLIEIDGPYFGVRDACICGIGDDSLDRSGLRHG